MKLVFILVWTAFTVCLSRELHRHKHKKKFPQGRETIQKDAYIGPKPGVQHNRLFPEYGTNFRYIGEVKHGLDRVTVVTSIPIPKYSDIRKKPLEFNCTVDLNRKEAKTCGSYQYRVHEYCAKVIPYVITDHFNHLLMKCYFGVRTHFYIPKEKLSLIHI